LSLSRFVIGDGMRQGYVFSHPRLENYFLEERLGTAERQEVERRFLTWGEKTLAVLNSDILQEALDKVMAIKDEYDRLDALVELATGLSEELLWQVLGALAPRIRDTLLSEALDIVQAMKDREQRAQVLEVLVSSLPEARKGERAQQIGKPSRRSGTKEGTRGLRHAIPPISPWGNDEFGPTTVFVGMGKRGQCLDP